MKPGDTLAVRIEKPAAGGWMIARADGRVILVSEAIPGEHAQVRIDRIGKGVAYGHATTIDEASVDRRHPFVEPACGGCLYAHIDYPRQLAIKSEVIADGLSRIGHIAWPSPIVVAASRETGYRMRSRLHIRGSRLGFFREGTHDLCEVRATQQLLPETCDMLDQLADRLRGQPSVSGELELSENLDASGRVVHLESASPVSESDWSRATLHLKLSGVTLQSPAASQQPVKVVSGDPHVTDVLSLDGHDVRVRRHVQAFFQGNRFLLHDLVTHVMNRIGTGDVVVDLYAGAGLFSLAAAIGRGAQVTAVEGDRIAAADLMVNAEGAGGAVRTVHQSVERFVSARRPAPSVLIVDPPRTGMSKDAVTGAIQMSARHVVYISCDVATLARDARRFLDGGYTIHDIAAFDLFPNTPHVETVVAFQAA